MFYKLSSLFAPAMAVWMIAMVVGFGLYELAGRHLGTLHIFAFAIFALTIIGISASVAVKMASRMKAKAKRRRETYRRIRGY